MNWDVDIWLWWAEFIGTVLVSYAAMIGTRSLVSRVAARWSDRLRLLVIALVAIFLGALLGVGSGLPLIVLFTLIAAVLGFYVGLLLAGAGWRHHLGTRVAFWGLVVAVAALSRAFV